MNEASPNPSPSDGPAERGRLRERKRAAQKRLVRRLGMGVSALSVLLVLSVFLLILRNERAHDEAACSFSAGEERELGAVHVREESRSCMPEIEERRYIVSRVGEASYELARKRLPKSRFAVYRWALRDEKAGFVLDMFVDDKLESEFHDEDAVKR